MNIQRAAELTGLSADTIRFYERRGVLPAPPRSANGYREYTEDHLATLRLARGLRGLELPLDDVAGILQVAHDATCGELRRTLEGTLAGAIGEVNARLAELTQTRVRLTALIDGVRTIDDRSDALPGMAPCATPAIASARPPSAGAPPATRPRAST